MLKMIFRKKKILLQKKGLVITLDAIFAVLAALTIILSVLFYMWSVSKVPFNKQALNRFSQDSLAMLEKDDTLRNAIEGNSNTTVILFLESLPEQICASIDLKDKDQNVIMTVRRADCPDSLESVHERRSFIADFNTYYARIECWYDADLPGGTI